MAAPKIKLYALPPGYSQDADQDVQLQQNDELLPCMDRSDHLTDAVNLTGVMLFGLHDQPAANLLPVDIDSGRYIGEPLVPPSGEIQSIGEEQGYVLMVDGILGPEIIDASGYPIPQWREGMTDPAPGVVVWVPHPSGFRFIGPPPSGALLSCYSLGGNPCTTWALPNSTPYQGANTSFNCIRIRVNNGSPTIASPNEVSGQKAYVTTASASGVTATGAFLQSATSYFIGESPNWITGHMQMWPDVFVGTVDYAGDDHTEMINGQPTIVSPGQLPKYVDPDTYQLSARDGLVIFTEPVDSAAAPVQANYAHLTNIANVTSQVLDPVVGSSGRKFRFGTEEAYPGSHGKRWVGRSDTLTPVNVYVNGNLTPTIVTVTPYDTLTIKTS